MREEPRTERAEDHEEDRPPMVGLDIEPSAQVGRQRAAVCLGGLVIVVERYAFNDEEGDGPPDPDKGEDHAAPSTTDI